MGSFNYIKKRQRGGRSPGKIDASLNEMLQNVEWGEFRLGDLFDVQSNPQLNKESFIFNESGEYPYFTRTVFNNGILGYVDYLDEEHKIKGNCLAVGMIGMQFFYMEKDFYAGQFTKSIVPKGFALTENIAKFLISILNRLQKTFQNILVRYFENTFNNTTIVLPTRKGQIDFDFMENFVSQIESERISELDSFLQTTGLSDFKLTNKEQQALDSFYNLEWREFNIVDIFKVKNTKNILSETITPCSGSTPYLCASAENNSVSTYISYDLECLEEGNCVFIGGKTFVVSFQGKDFYSNDSHNLCLYLKENKHRNKLKQLFIATCVNKSLKYKYSWGNSVSKGKIMKDKIKFPCKNGCPDYEVMETIISAVQKLVIKNGILYCKNKMQK